MELVGGAVALSSEAWVIEEKGSSERGGKGLLSSLQRLVSVSLVHPGQGPWHMRGLCPRRGVGQVSQGSGGMSGPQSYPSVTTPSQQT